MNISDFKIGQKAEIQKAFTEADLKMFANISLDNNPIHLDADYAQTTFFKQRIVHGFLCGSLISAVIGTKLPGPGAIYISQELKFKKPVYLNETVNAVVTVTDIREDKSILFLETICLKNNNEVVIEGKAVIKLI